MAPVPELAPLTYTIPQAAKALNVSHNMVRDRVNNGSIPSVRIGRRVLISRVVLAQWVLDHSSTSPDEAV